MAVPVISNAPRNATYSPVNSAGPFTVPFPLFDPTGADILVYLGAAPLTGWTLTCTQSTEAVGTFINGAVTLAAPVTGTLTIRGRRAPRRAGQYQEGKGVSARSQNFEFNLLTAMLREAFDRFGEVDAAFLRTLSLNEADLFNALGHEIIGLPPTVSDPSSAVSALYAALHYLTRATGSATSPFDAGFSEIANVKYPTAPFSAANVQYVNDLITLVRSEIPTAAGGISTYSPGIGATTRTLASKLIEYQSATDYGAVAVANSGLAGATDATVALQKLLDTGKDLDLGDGYFKVTAPLILKTPGQTIRGRGRDRTCIAWVAGAFTGTAVFRTDTTIFSGTGQPGPVLRDFRVKGFQPEVNPALSVSAQIAQLQDVSCLDFRDTIAFQLHNMALTAGMRAVDMRGQTGGAVINNLQSNAFVANIDIDGALDTVHVHHLHDFPYDITVNQKELQRLNSTAIKLGRVDDFKCTDSMSIQGNKAVWAFYSGARTLGADGYTSPGGTPTGAFNGFNFDITPLGIDMDGGVLSFSGGYMASVKMVDMTAGFLTFNGFATANINVDQAIVISSGTLNFSDCALIVDNNTDFTFIRQTGGNVILADNFYNWTGGGNITKAKVWTSGGRLTANGNVVVPFGGGTAGANGLFFRLDGGGPHSVSGPTPGWANTPGATGDLIHTGNFANVGIIPARIGGASQRSIAQRLAVLPITPWDFGATGGADDTSAVQAAINAAIANYPQSLDLSGSWNVSKVTASGGNGLIITGASNLVANSGAAQTSVLEIAMPSVAVMDRLILNVGYRTNYEAGLSVKAPCQYGFYSNVSVVGAKIGARFGRSDQPSALVSEITVSTLQTYGCPVALELVGVETVIHFVGVQIGGDAFGGNTAWGLIPKRAARIIGATAVFEGGEVLLTSATDGANIEFQPLTGTSGEGTKYGRVTFLGTHLEGGSPFVIMSNPSSLAIGALDGSRDLINMQGVVGYHSQNLAPMIATAADWVGDVVIGGGCSVACNATRTQPTVSCGGTNTHVYIDDNGLGPTLLDPVSGVSGGVVHFGHRCIFYGTNLGTQAVAANGTKTVLKFQSTDAGGSRSRFNSGYSTSTGVFTVPTGGLKDVKVSAGVLVNVPGHLYVVVNGTELGYAWAPAYGNGVVWSIPALAAGDLIKITFEPDAGAGACLGVPSQNWLSIDARN